MSIFYLFFKVFYYKFLKDFCILQNFYGEKFGAENLELIKDSNTVIPENLKPEKAYIQVGSDYSFY